ncbi:MAG: DNA polymerase III subunit delta [Stomatobaculum sp.]|nr:DNA polymerase III subunit delta [Stomatobaculum sp.]
MKNLNSDLKSGNFKPVYLLYGDEAYLKQNYKNRFRKAAAGDDGMNVSVFEGKDISEDAVIDIAGTMPFFSERRLVIVENSGWFKNKTEKIADFLESFPDTTVLLFLEEETDKRNRLYKTVQKLGYLCELTHPDRRELSIWAARYLAASGKKITASTMDHFLERVGDDMQNVRNELEKLISYLGEEEVVTVRDVDMISSGTVTNRIFDMVRAIAARRTGEALDLYNDLLTLREAPMRILVLIARQYQQLLSVKELTAAGKDRNEIAKSVKIPAFAVGKLQQQAKSIRSAALFAKIRRCAELEEAVKTGNLQDRLAVELLITEE